LVRINVEVEDRLRRQIKMLAAREGRSLSDLLREQLHALLAQQQAANDQS